MSLEFARLITRGAGPHAPNPAPTSAGVHAVSGLVQLKGATSHIATLRRHNADGVFNLADRVYLVQTASTDYRPRALCARQTLPHLCVTRHTVPPKQWS